MKRDQLARLQAEGREQYVQLLGEANALLANLDTSSPQALAAAMDRRQKILDGIQTLDGRLAAEGGAQSDFLAFREEATQRILAVDGLVIALARQKQAAITERLASQARSKSASQSYEKTFPSGQRPWLNNKV